MDFLSILKRYLFIGSFLFVTVFINSFGIRIMQASKTSVILIDQCPPSKSDNKK